MLQFVEGGIQKKKKEKTKVQHGAFLDCPVTIAGEKRSFG